MKYTTKNTMGTLITESKTKKNCIVCNCMTEFIEITSEARFCSTECNAKFFEENEYVPHGICRLELDRARTMLPMKKDFMFEHIILTTAKKRYTATISVQPKEIPGGDNNV
jgi:hypothetical protein